MLMVGKLCIISMWHPLALLLLPANIPRHHSTSGTSDLPAETGLQIKEFYSTKTTKLKANMTTVWPGEPGPPASAEKGLREGTSSTVTSLQM